MSRQTPSIRPGNAIRPVISKTNHQTEETRAGFLSNSPGVKLTRVNDILRKKLNPARFPGMSPFMAAIVGYVLGEAFTDPQIAEITVSEQENLLYVRKVGGVGFDGIQSLEDMRNNWNRLLDVAGLTDDERREAVGLFRAKVETVPGTHI